MTIIKKNKNYVIHYGNRKLADLNPDYFEMDNENYDVIMNVDGEKKGC